MSLLLSDSLLGIIDEKSLEDDLDVLGRIKIGAREHTIDAFISDKKTIRVHAIGDRVDAVEHLCQSLGQNATLVIGDNDLKISGKVHQVGWEITHVGGRVIICVVVSDK